MDDFTIAIYCFCDDFCQLRQEKPDVKRKLNDAQIMSTAIIAALYFGGNHFKACDYMRCHHGFQKVDKSNFNRQLHRLNFIMLSMFRACSDSIKKLNTTSVYIIDSFPVSVCGNIRIPRAKILQDEAYRGYNSSKREYFYGFKVQMIVSQEGIPVDFFIAAGSLHDITAFQGMNLDLPAGSELYGVLS